MKPKEAEASFAQFKKVYASGELPQMILLYGEERLLKLDYFKKLNAKLGGGDEMNVTRYEGKQACGPIIDQAETLPFLSDRRILLFLDTGLFKAGGNDLADYLKEPCETTWFVFCETDVDEKSKLYHIVKEKGIVAQIEKQGEGYLLACISGFMKREGKQISVAAAKRLLELTGADLTTMNTELEKLASYCMDKEVVELDDVNAICSESLDAKIYELMDSILHGNRVKAMSQYYDLLALKTKNRQILSGLAYRYRDVVYVKKLRETESVDKIPSIVGFGQFQLKYYLSQAGAHSLKELEDGLRACVETEEAVNGGHIEESVAVEALLLTLME